MKKLILGFFTSVLFSLTVLSFANAQTCPPAMQLTYSDGEKGCITDLPISKEIDRVWGKPIADVVRNAKGYAVAYSEACKVASIGTSIHNTYAYVAIAEQHILSNCSAKCKCAIVIRDGQVLMSKKFASLLQTSYTLNLVTEAESPAREKQPQPSKEQEKKKSPITQQVNEQGLYAASEDQIQRIKDRELLTQLSAELARLRAEAEAQKNQTSNDKKEKTAVNTLQPAVQALPVFANRKALVIGNDGYKYVSKLLNAGEDAKSIAENLAKVGYKVTLKLDQSEKEMKSAIRTFKSQVEAGDEVAFFYAGHGVQISNVNYLLPVDVGGEGEEQVRDEAISLQRILDDMNEKKVKFTLAMVDACRDNPFKSSGRSIGGGSRGLAPTTAATGQMIVFSAGAGQQALDKLGPADKDKNGLFTRMFIKEMQKSGVTIDQLVRNVRSEVVKSAKNIGHEQVPAIYDQVVGEFYFRK